MIHRRIFIKTQENSLVFLHPAIMIFLLPTTALALLSSIALAQHTIYSNLPDGSPRIPNGPHGQECEGVHGGAKCEVGEFFSILGGEVACTHNFDCCPCGQVKCTEGCTGLVCNGDSSCFGIKDVILEGDTEMGVGIICNGTYRADQGITVNYTSALFDVQAIPFPDSCCI